MKSFFLQELPAAAWLRHRSFRTKALRTPTASRSRRLVRTSRRPGHFYRDRAAEAQRALVHRALRRQRPETQREGAGEGRQWL